MSGLRITGGTFRGQNIPVPGSMARPTTDRVRESFFATIQPCLQNRVFIDLFAGSGIMGLEAISRGASYSVMVDIHGKVIHHLKQVTQKLNCQNQTKIIKGNAENLIGSLVSKYPEAIIFLDPPYQTDLISRCLANLVQKFYSETYLVIGEFHHKKKIVLPRGVKQIRQKKYGETVMDFWKAEPESQDLTDQTRRGISNE